MGRPKNKAKTIHIDVAVSERINNVLDQIAATGYIGVSGPQVALHFIEEGVMKALDNPHFGLTRNRPAKKR